MRIKGVHASKQAQGLRARVLGGFGNTGLQPVRVRSQHSFWAAFGFSEPSSAIKKRQTCPDKHRAQATY